MRAAWLALALAARLAGQAEPPRLWWTLPSPSASGLLSARAQAINAALDAFDIGYRQWDIHQLVCPLLQHHWVYQFVALDRAALRSEFVLIVPLDNAPPLVLPLLYGGGLHPGSVTNPQNIAQFNRMMARERLKPAGDAAWLELTELYMQLLGDQPQLLDAGNLPALRSRLPKKWTPPMPQVTIGPDGGATVSLATITSTLLYGHADVVSWRFRFDAGGRLRGLDAPERVALDP